MTKRNLLSVLAAFACGDRLSADQSTTADTQQRANRELRLNTDEGHVKVRDGIQVYEQARVTEFGERGVSASDIDESHFETVGKDDNEIVVLVPLEWSPVLESSDRLDWMWMLDSASGRTRPLQETSSKEITYIRAYGEDSLHGDDGSRTFVSIHPMGSKRMHLCFVYEQFDQLAGGPEFTPTLYFEPTVEGDYIGGINSDAAISWDLGLDR